MDKKSLTIFIAPFIVVFSVVYFVSYRLLALYGVEEVSAASAGGGGWTDLVVGLLVVTALILLVQKFFKRRAGSVFRLFFYLALFGSYTVFFSSLTVYTIPILVLSIFVTVVYIKIKNIFVHNIAILVSFGSIAALVGLSFNPRQVVAILAALSLYDYIAVYVTGHMQKMAVGMIGEGVVPAVVLARGKGEVPKRTAITPGTGNVAVLGGGDLILPASLAASVYTLNIFDSLLVCAFVIFGAIATAYIFQSGKREPIPALPPLAFFAILGYIATILI